MIANIQTPTAIKIISFFYAAAGSLGVVLCLNRSLLEYVTPDNEISNISVLWMMGTSVITIICSLYLWRMKQWAGYLLFIVFVFSLAFSKYNSGGISGYDLVNIIPLYFIYKHLGQME